MNKANNKAWNNLRLKKMVSLNVKLYHLK